MVTLARLRSVRQRKALTQQELAEKAGVNRVTIARLEGGVDEPRPATVRKLAAALDVEPGNLMGRSSETRGSGQPSRRAGRSLSSVPKPGPKSRQALVALGERLDVADDERVRRVLKRAPDLAGLIIESADQLMKFFPDARLRLESQTDPDESEGAGESLLLGILTRLRGDEALNALRRFDEGWWLRHIGQAQGRLVIDLEYE